MLLIVPAGFVHVPPALKVWTSVAVNPPLAASKTPVTSAVRETAPKLGAPDALPCRTVVVVPSDDTTPGAVAAPPPNIKALVVSSDELPRVEVDEKNGMPPDVPVAVSPSVHVTVHGDPDTVSMDGAVRVMLVTVPEEPPPLAPPGGVIGPVTSANKTADASSAAMPIISLRIVAYPMNVGSALAVAVKEVEPPALVMVAWISPRGR